MRRFAYRLALKLGRSNVDEMLRSMTAVQFREWIEFYRLEPFGEDREDLRIATVVQVLMNVHRDSKRRRQPYSILDCVLAGGDLPAPGAPRPAARQSWQEMKLIAMMAAAQSEPPRKRK